MLCLKSYCLISDCLNHNTNVAHKCISAGLNEIKAKHPNVAKCIYFTYAASSQSINCKNVINLCHHNSGHDLEAEWDFLLVMAKAHVMG